MSALQRLIDAEFDLFSSEIDGDETVTRDDLMSKIQEIVQSLQEEIEIDLANALEQAVDDHFDEECIECNASRECAVCEGTGTCQERVFVNGGLEAHLDECDVCDGSRQCLACKGSGKCPFCRGSGKRYQE